MLTELMLASFVQAELELGSDGQLRDRAPLIAAVDTVNGKFRNGTICAGSGKVCKVPREWGMRQEHKTSCFITEWDEIPTERDR
jgi:hypothetical protein